MPKKIWTKKEFSKLVNKCFNETFKKNDRYDNYTLIPCVDRGNDDYGNYCMRYVLCDKFRIIATLSISSDCGMFDSTILDSVLSVSTYRMPIWLSFIKELKKAFTGEEE